eukprot:1363896-Rhodomonas_salina.2
MKGGRGRERGREGEGERESGRAGERESRRAGERERGRGREGERGRESARGKREREREQYTFTRTQTRTGRARLWGLRASATQATQGWLPTSRWRRGSADLRVRPAEVVKRGRCEGAAPLPRLPPRFGSPARGLRAAARAMLFPVAPHSCRHYT